MQGVRVELDFLAKDLRKAMIMTSCNSIAEIDGRIFSPAVGEEGDLFGTV